MRLLGGIGRLTAAALVLATLVLAAAASAWSGERLTVLGVAALPKDAALDGVPVGGLSAIDYDAERGVFLALSDDRAQRGPARFYELTIEIGADGPGPVEILRAVSLSDDRGAAYKRDTLDPEGLRLAPATGAAAERLYWSHEGDARGRPFAGAMDRAGKLLAEFSPPAYYAPSSNHESGIRDNRGFEALAVTGDGLVALGLEAALQQDGGEAGFETGSRNRVLLIDPSDGLPKAEYAYVTEPIPARPYRPEGEADNGLVELLAAPGGGFYALERSYVEGVGVTARLFRVSADRATNVLGTARLGDVDATPMSKTLLLTLRSGEALEHVDNLEGMCWGPRLGDRRTLVLVSDDNFNPQQTTQFVIVAVDGVDGAGGAGDGANRREAPPWPALRDE